MKSSWHGVNAGTVTWGISVALIVGGCVVHDHHRDQVDLVDVHGAHHQGYYDEGHSWHGGYYDEGHSFHDDPHDWHQ